MNKLQAYLQERSEVIARMRAILDLAEDEKRELTEDETKEYGELNTKVDVINEKIEREKKLTELEVRKSEIINPLPNFEVKKFGDVDPEKEFKSIGEFLHAVAAHYADGTFDMRLKPLVEKREQLMGVGSQGGFMVPEQFRPDLYQVAEQGATVRPRASVIPAGDPPDAKITMPALDQTQAKGMFGGVTITHGGERVNFGETDADFRQVSLEPKKMSAFTVCSDELLRNWGAAGTFFPNILRRAMAAQEDYDALRGTGVNQMLGVINSAAAVSYARAGANAVAFADVYGMYARMKMGGSPVWLASQTIIPQLAAMVDAGSHAVWLGGNLVGSASQPMPSTLFGIPIYFCDRLPALGTKGDLGLYDLSYYLIKDGSGPFVAVSEHVYFTTGAVVFRIDWRVDGKPWLTEPLALEGASTSTVSPFVILQ